MSASSHTKYSLNPAPYDSMHMQQSAHAHVAVEYPLLAMALINKVFGCTKNVWHKTDSQ